MRIMFNDDCVESFTGINATPYWNPNKGSSEDNPIGFCVYLDGLYNCFGDDGMIGEYILDGTKETYNAAVNNFKGICDRLLTKGWCKQTDFVNFEWF